MLKSGYFKVLLEEAEKEVAGVSGADAAALLEDGSVVFVDVRDVRELDRDGRIPNAFHAPRGVLEFWIDPESPYHKPIFASDRTFVFYCAKDWRGVLSAQLGKRMGLSRVFHLAGGLEAWKQAGYPVDSSARSGSSKKSA